MESRSACWSHRVAISFAHRRFLSMAVVAVYVASAAVAYEASQINHKLTFGPFERVTTVP